MCINYIAFFLILFRISSKFLEFLKKMFITSSYHNYLIGNKHRCGRTNFKPSLFLFTNHICNALYYILLCCLLSNPNFSAHCYRFLIRIFRRQPIFFISTIFSSVQCHMRLESVSQFIFFTNFHSRHSVRLCPTDFASMNFAPKFHHCAQFA